MTSRAQTSDAIATCATTAPIPVSPSLLGGALTQEDGSESIRLEVHGARADWLATRRQLGASQDSPCCLCTSHHSSSKPINMLRATRPATLIARQARLYSTKAEQNLGNEFVTERAATAAHAKRAL